MKSRVNGYLLYEKKANNQHSVQKKWFFKFVAHRAKRIYNKKYLSRKL